MYKDRHINLADLNKVLRDVNLALQWKASVIHLRTDSVYVHHWISDSLPGKARVCTKVMSEILIRSRLTTLQVLASEYELAIHVTFVKSNENQANQLTRMPQQWLDEIQKKRQPIKLATHRLESAHTWNIHQFSGHPCIKLNFVRMVSLGIPKEAVQEWSETVTSVNPLKDGPVRRG